MRSPDHDPDDLAGQAQPLAGPDLITVPVGDIPKPPPELVDELDNQADAGVEEAGGAALEVATLDFVGDDLPVRAIALRHPFKWQGARHDTITVRQLTTAEMGDIVNRSARSKTMPDRMEIYGAMTGLPAAVLRALPALDGERVMDAAFDFLPPLFRPESG